MVVCVYVLAFMFMYYYRWYYFTKPEVKHLAARLARAVPRISDTVPANGLIWVSNINLL